MERCSLKSHIPTPALAQGGEDAHLAVVDLAGGAAVLPAYAYRRVALLAEGGLVDVKGAVGVAADQLVEPGGDLGRHRMEAPRGGPDELLHALVVAVEKGLAEGFHVLFPGRGEQSAQIAGRMARPVHPPGDEAIGEVSAKIDEAARRTAKQDGVIFLFLCVEEIQISSYVVEK
ncbi:hypothetical protein QEH53_09005 [Pelagicoccus sp. SDUM812002]|nr:hypothetical protein [Pelagicoccus sp. SDUM812002]